jgi:hypothetical protein
VASDPTVSVAVHGWNAHITPSNVGGFPDIFIASKAAPVAGPFMGEMLRLSGVAIAATLCEIPISL